jgi:periplasmic divalent cation tolerance protein
MFAEPLIECTTTFDSEESAAACAESLLERRLAGCVQIAGPIVSIYRWQGSIHRDREWKLTIKSTARIKEKLIQAIRELHSYQEPEILIYSITDASPGYAQWLTEQTTNPS